jgi:hypothetical protein
MLTISKPGEIDMIFPVSMPRRFDDGIGPRWAGRIEGPVPVEALLAGRVYQGHEADAWLVGEVRVEVVVGAERCESGVETVRP